MDIRSISIVIPARNEAAFLPRCLDAIERARASIPQALEIIVVLNRCTDNTEEIALQRGCKVVHFDGKNLAAIRNAGAWAASGEVLITVDADSFLSPNMLKDVVRKLSSDTVIGGGVMMYPERWSLGILATGFLLVPLALWYGGISGGLFYCLKSDFVAIGGFREDLVSAEDVDFGYRLKRYGKTKRKRYSTIFSSWIVTSCRKFDAFGDWFVFRQPLRILRALRGRDQELANEFWYDFPRE